MEKWDAGAYDGPFKSTGETWARLARFFAEGGSMGAEEVPGVMLMVMGIDPLSVGYRFDLLPLDAQRVCVEWTRDFLESQAASRNARRGQSPEQTREYLERLKRARLN